MTDTSKKAKLNDGSAQARTGVNGVAMRSVFGRPHTRPAEKTVTLITNASLQAQGERLGEAGRSLLLSAGIELDAMRDKWLQLLRNKIDAIKRTDTEAAVARDDERKRQLFAGARASDVHCGVLAPSQPISFDVDLQSPRSVNEHKALLQRVVAELRYDATHNGLVLPWRECLPFGVRNAMVMRNCLLAWALEEEREAWAAAPPPLRDESSGSSSSSSSDDDGA